MNSRKLSCTWLALSREAHGYQAGPQLNVGVHADHVVGDEHHQE